MLSDFICGISSEEDQITCLHFRFRFSGDLQLTEFSSHTLFWIYLLTYFVCVYLYLR